jgi:lysozyme
MSKPWEPLFVIPDSGIEIVKRFEGLHKVVFVRPTVTVAPYLDPVGILTIGYGHTGPDVVHGMLITEAEAEQLLMTDLARFVEASLRLCPRLWIEPPDRLAAIASFAFNLGAGRLQTSTLRRRVNEGDWIGAHAELQRWVYAGGKKLPGLIARRAAEGQLLLNPA